MPACRAVRCWHRRDGRREGANEVVLTQVCAQLGSDERTDQVVAKLLEDGTAWISGSTWHAYACCGSR